jgi:5-methyltetrahydropteroyltriglutamate--homocysteine methyltransferase
MALSSIQGFPRIGRRRELKFATEGYWSGKDSADRLGEVAADLRRQNWTLMREAGVDMIPSNDFSLYDHVLDTIALVGAVPPRYGHSGDGVDLETYFAMARGRQTEGQDVVAMEMTKWFDTNYHYIVPELSAGMEFSLSGDKPWKEFAEAAGMGIPTVPVLVGPVSFLLLGKPSSDADGDVDPLKLLERLLPVYEQILSVLGSEGAMWVHMDEPAFVQDRSEDELAALASAYEQLAQVPERPKILVKTYFDHVGEAFPVLRDLPVEGIGLDFVHGPANEELVTRHGGLRGKTLMAGVVDGRNVWINDLSRSLALLERLKPQCEDLIVSTSCSLIHVPIDLSDEPKLDGEIAQWLAFARQKVDEVVTLTKALNEEREAVEDQLSANREAIERRRQSPRIVHPKVRRRVESLVQDGTGGRSNYEERLKVQQANLNLPPFPTTTIGSYPQTERIRQVRAALRSGEITQHEYEDEMRQEIERVIRFQEKAGLDVLVHGEPERNDMVQYFAEQLEGYLFTQRGWVQSYGTRYVRPPILYGDIHRPRPMTVEWLEYAQSLTDRPVKGMLTGPVTMLMWSFVRDDQPLEKTCTQLALAIRDEVLDLEAAGLRIIQVDEAALREGLPLRRQRRQEYLDWAVRCFRLSTSGVADETHIQMHMCYSDFGDIIEAIKELDADVSLIEASRSNMELLENFAVAGYERGIGPGVYDIHSPRVPTVDEMTQKLRTAAKTLAGSWIWVNPDCGLKTRGWEETESSLNNMVAAAERVREESRKL